MSLYQCEQCGVIENTACSNYHWRRYKEEALLCSECDPEIKKWHGRFEKEFHPIGTMETDELGNIRRKESNE